MLYNEFTSEAAFRDEFVRPLLTRLGFLSVAELDGPQEFGKDFVFSELTAFGFLRHYAVVAKHEKAIRQPATRLCGTILSQIRQAFSVKFRLSDSAQEQRVASVIVMNSGSITSNAVQWLRAELELERYGENVHIFDGDRLAQLDRSAAFHRAEQLIPKLVGLQTQLRLNEVVWSSIDKSLPRFPEVRGSFVRALEEYATAPFLDDMVSANEVLMLLQECRIIDAINHRYMSGIRVTDEIKASDVEKLREVIARATARSVAIRVRVAQQLVKFCSPLAPGS